MFWCSITFSYQQKGYTSLFVDRPIIVSIINEDEIVIVYEKNNSEFCALSR